MPNYTKLFNSIVTSTIWTEDDKTRILWITMLAMSDQHGEVHASIPGLARIAGIDTESAEQAINKFMAPDPYSRTPDNQGRRIAKIEGGWEILNHKKYRIMASKEDAKAANNARVKRHRERKENVTLCNGDVMVCNGDVMVQRDIAEADTDTDIVLPKGKNNTRSRFNPAEIKLPFESSDFSRMWESWITHRKEIKKPITERTAIMQLERLKEMGETRAIAAMKYSMTNGWQGIYEDNKQSPLFSMPQTRSASHYVNPNEERAEIPDL